MPSQLGVGRLPSLPYIHSAVSSWTTANTTTTVVAQDLKAPAPENPIDGSASKSGVCARP